LAPHDVQQKPADRVPLTAWLSLDESDNDLRLFLRYFVAALREVAPDACQSAVEMLKWREEPSAADWLASLSNDLAFLTQKLILVLDDYHVIRNPAIHDFLNDLLFHWPEPLHLVLLTRFTPPLSIARLRAKGKVVEIRNHDLRFSLEEITKYVHQTWPVSLSQSNLELLEQKTEGWVAGLQLASLSLRTRENVETILASLSGTNADIADYLIDEVLSRQPDAFHMFQLKTSILENFCPSLCEAIMANEDPDWTARAMLDWLEHGNLFIIRLDDHREWYRYHPLFRELLQERLLARLSQDDIADLHRRAARWFAQNSFWAKAVNHALAVQDLKLVVQLLREGFPTILNQEDLPIMNYWLSLLPESFVNSRPDVLIIRAWTLQFSWQLEAVSKILQEIEMLLDQGEWATQLGDYYHLLLGQIAELKAQQAYHKSQPALCLSYCEVAMTLLPLTWTYARGSMLLYQALSMQLLGQGVVAERMLLDHYETLRDKADTYALRLLMALALNYIQMGQFEKAQQTAHHMLEKAERNGLVVIVGWASLILGIVHYQWDHLDIAGQHFDRLVTKRRLFHALSAREGIIGAALVRLASGRHTEAWQLMELLSEIDMERHGRLDDATESLRARLMLANGNVEDASYWANNMARLR
jgi:LuxR family transcriptional regulator, maltose regulon positive regulatory protein